MNKIQAAWKILTTRSWNEDLDLSGANSLFGSIGRNVLPIATNKAFIPLDNQSNVLQLAGNHPPSWLGLENKQMQYWAYRYCSPLAGVIDRLAEADTNGRIGIVNLDGTPKKNVNSNPALYRIMKLFKRPNPLQTWEEFNSQQVVLCKIFGYCLMFAISPVGMDKSYSKSIWNFSPNFCDPTVNDDFDIFDPESSPIKSWHGTILGKSYTIPAADMLIIKDAYVDSEVQFLGLPMSKIAGLDYWISNICAAMEADNVLLKKKGPLGIFSFDPKPDMAGWVPMKNDEKTDLQDDLKRYGLTIGQLQYVVSKIPIKWNPMSFNLRDLMTKETVRQGIDGICDRFGYPAELMSGKNATYENRSSAEKFLYQTGVIPFSLRRCARYDLFFGIDRYDCMLNLSYNHLPVLQEDIMHAGQASVAESQALDIDWKNGIITYDEYREAKEYDPIGGEDGKMKYPEYAKKYGIDLNPKSKPNGTPPKDTSTKK